MSTPKMPQIAMLAASIMIRLSALDSGVAAASGRKPSA
jgi:hypothetical protein